MFESPNSDEGDNKNEKRRIVISPSDIGSLFGSQLNQVNTQSLQEDYDMEEQDSDDKTERFNEVSNNQDNVIIQELKMLERMQTSNAIDQKNINEIESLEDIDDKYDFVDELDLNAVLDKNSKQSVLNSLSMSILNKRKVTTNIGPRLVKYDPSENGRQNNPMDFGAYRRWKVVEEKKTKPTKGKRKKSSKNAAEKFYDAIKNLGSAPSTGGATGTGVAEPPPNKGPIQPKKGIPIKNKKRVITPDDIDSLFDKTQSNDDSQKSRIVDLSDTNLSDQDSEVYSDNSDIDKMIQKTSFDFENDEIPKWLDDAAKAEKVRRDSLIRKSKQKSITKDWRFWASIIAAFAFGSAYITLSKESGGNGFGNFPSSSTLNIINKNRDDNSELVI